MARTALAVVALIAAAAVDAPRDWRRALNQHLFIPSLVVLDPFVPTAFTLSTGGGIADVRIPVAPELAGYRFGDGAYRLGSLSQTIAFQAGVTRWLGLRLSGTAAAVGGVSLDSAAAIGGTLGYETRFGLTAGTTLGRFVRLALVTDLAWRQARSLVPLDGIAETILSGRLELAVETRTRTFLSLLPGVSLAVAPHAALGFVVSAQLGWERVDEAEVRSDGGRALVGAVIDLDLRALSRAVPLGLVAAYRAQLPFGTDEKPAHDLEGGLYYTGRDALALGLVARASWFELRPGLPTRALGGGVVLRTFFR